MKNVNKGRRASDKLNASTIRAEDARDHLKRIKRMSKSTIARAAEHQLARFTNTIKSLENKLNELKLHTKGIVSWLRAVHEIKMVKREIKLVKENIEAWISSVYRFLGV